VVMLGNSPVNFLLPSVNGSNFGDKIIVNYFIEDDPKRYVATLNNTTIHNFNAGTKKIFLESIEYVFMN
jgi:hypothetical protein